MRIKDPGGRQAGLSGFSGGHNDGIPIVVAS